MMHSFFWNRPIDKGGLKRLIAWFLTEHGTVLTVAMLEELKRVGFHYATVAGISLGIEDLRIPPSKKALLAEAQAQIDASEFRYQHGKITEVERFQRVIDTWHGTSERLKDRVIENFLETDPMNPVYIMAFSGARGNISQVRQLVGMRGLMADPQGQIIDLPIRSNFREGLNVTEYIISCYGARKGLVDTALRTANSGYLTRRLVDVAQDVIIRQMDCATTNSILVKPLYEQGKRILSLEDRLVGRLLSKRIRIRQGKIVAKRNQEISPPLAQELANLLPKGVYVRSPLTCEAIRSICQFCYGWSLAHGSLVHLGEAVGIIAAQSIGEPGTQLTMRTFHTGGVFSGDVQDQLRAPHAGLVQYPDRIDAFVIRTRHGDAALATKQPSSLALVHPDHGTTLLPLPNASILYPRQGTWVEEQSLLAEFSSFEKDSQESAKSSKDVTSRLPGEVYFADLVIQENTSDEDDNDRLCRAEQSGSLWVLEGQLYHPALSCRLFVCAGDWIEAGAILSHHETRSPITGFLEQISPEQVKIQQPLFQIPISHSSILQRESDLYYAGTLPSGDRLEWRIPLVDTHVEDNEFVFRLQTDLYRTQGPGQIYYSGGAYPSAEEWERLLWVPEEIHSFDTEGWVLHVKEGQYLVPGEPIASLQADGGDAHACRTLQGGWVCEATPTLVRILPGWVYQVDKSSRALVQEGLLAPGDPLVEGVVWEGSYLMVEWVKKSKGLVLLRPVTTYDLYPIAFWQDRIMAGAGTPPKGISVKVVPAFPYNHGDRILDPQGVDLASLWVDIQGTDPEFPGYLESCVVAPKAPGSRAAWQIYREGDMDIIPSWALERDLSEAKLLFQDSREVSPQTPMAVIRERSPYQGEFHCASKGPKGLETALFLTDEEEVICKLPEVQGLGHWTMEIGDLLEPGQEMAPGWHSQWSGQIVQMTDELIHIRLAQPYRVSSQTQIHVQHGDLIRARHNLFTLIYEKLKTGDIVQGLPKIEEILEARVTKGFALIADSPTGQLETLFKQNMRVFKGDSQKAARTSLQTLQQILVQGVQSVYLAQGVQIADKHVEIIVRQMTSKVLIEEGGYTCLLPGELVELQRIEKMNFRSPVKASYRPLVMGVTKAALATESFISAASFQETTRILTQAAVEGKTDWLRGLKENVILGRLIPAGTGFHAQQLFHGTTQYDRIQWSLDPRAGETEDPEPDVILMTDALDQSVFKEVVEEVVEEVSAPIAETVDPEEAL
jgi:DNA-directed RNA polymerase subunit beta'